MACDPENTITDAKLANANCQLGVIDDVVEKSTETTTTCSGATIYTLRGQLARLGWIPPIPYAAAISFTANDGAKTVERSTAPLGWYAPRQSELPFTTSGTWTADDENKFYKLNANDLSQISATLDGNGVANTEQWLNNKWNANAAEVRAIPSADVYPGYTLKIADNPDSYVIKDGTAVDDGEYYIVLTDNPNRYAESTRKQTKYKQIPAPLTAAVAALAGAGVLTGTYEYAITYYTASGETTPSGGTNQVVAASNQISVTGIPTSNDPNVIGRRLYRTYNGASDVVLKRLVVDIADNTTTSHTDNIADGSLGVYINRVDTTGGSVIINSEVVAHTGQSSTKYGYQAMQNNTPYASDAYGSFSLKNATYGYRNVGFGSFSLTSLTTGYNNSAGGIHGLNFLTTGYANTVWGYSAGFYLVSGSNNTLFGNDAGRFIAGAVSRYTAVGSRSILLNANVLDNGTNTAFGFESLMTSQFGINNLCLGAYAGKYFTGNNGLFVDAFDRGNETNDIDNAIMAGHINPTKANQFIKFNCSIRSANASYYNPVSVTSDGYEVKQDGTNVYAVTSTATVNCQEYIQGGASIGVIQLVGGTTTNFVSLSDERAKTKIAPCGPATIETMKINIKCFDWKNGSGTVKYGLVAQDLNKTNPEAVSVGDESKPWGVDPSKLIPQLIKTIQELEARLTAAGL